MTDELVIKATYADYKRVNGRKVLQLICEVPIEQAPLVHRTLGEPGIGDGAIWVAIAKLKKPVPQQQQKAQEPGVGSPPSGSSADKHRLSRQAAMCCDDMLFRTFLSNEKGVLVGDGAAEATRRLCLVASRAEFNTDPAAAARWETLHGEYLLWKDCAA